jgi:hypothetical protein
MLSFEGRSSDIITIPSKPDPTDFKLFLLGDSGYTFNWEATKPKLNGGAIRELNRIQVEIQDIDQPVYLNPTQSVIARLCRSLYDLIEQGYQYHLYLDNLFVN